MVAQTSAGDAERSSGGLRAFSMSQLIPKKSEYTLQVVLGEGAQPSDEFLNNPSRHDQVTKEGLQLFSGPQRQNE